MALITLRQLLDHAAEFEYGVPAFNVNNLEQMRADTRKNRGDLPFIFGSMRKGVGVPELVEFLKIEGGLC